jgi:type I restriction enzyme S subunit
LIDFKTFLENFDAIAEAPGGIPKLRSLILALAVRGKLVPQNPEDEPAELLRNKIVVEKQNLEKSKKIPKQRSLTPVQEDEQPYFLPSNWCWCRWNDIALYIGDIDHKMPTEVSEGIPYVSPRDFKGENTIDFEGAKKISYEDFERLKRKVQPTKDDIIFPRYGTIGENRLVEVDIDFLASYSCAIIKNFHGYIEPKYSYYYSISKLVKSEIERYTNKTTQANVGIQSIQNFLYPLPPLAEQKRIVEKVDELMALCDRYEAAKQTRDNLRQKLRGSAIASLMNAETDEELDAAWALVRDNWHNLGQYPEDIDSLRKMVLELAMRGKLTSQQEEDEPSHILLEKIKHKKEALDSQGKKDRKYKGLILNNKNYKIPKSWEWVKWIDVGFCQNGKAFPSNDYSDRGIKLLRPGNLHVSGKLQWTQANTKYLSTSYIEKYPEFIVGSNELIMNLTAQSLKDEFLGRVCLTDESEYCLLNQRLARIIPVGFLNEFCLIIFKSPLFRHFVDELNQGTLIQHMYTSQLNDFKFPLPPLAEQKRIVAKVDELMQLCDQLEASLRQIQQRAESLAASAINHLII